MFNPLTVKVFVYNYMGALTLTKTPRFVSVYSVWYIQYSRAPFASWIGH